MSKDDRSIRYDMKFEVVFDDGEAFMAGPVVNVSETGLYIETTMPPPAGTLVRITPLLPESAGLFEFEAEVVRKNDLDYDEHFDRIPGMGLRFVNMSDDEKSHLKTLLDKAKSAATDQGTDDA